MGNWFMFDNHTFRQLSDIPHEAVEEAMAYFEQDGCGIVFSKEDTHPLSPVL